MKLVCDYHLSNPDQAESMQCEDCNRCIDCGSVYFDDEDSLIEDACPNCNKKSKSGVFEFEFISSQEGVRKCIKACEGKHTQQVAYSSFHDSLTQVCFGCLKVRSNIRK